MDFPKPRDDPVTKMTLASSANMFKEEEAAAALVIPKDCDGDRWTKALEVLLVLRTKMATAESKERAEKANIMVLEKRKSGNVETMGIDDGYYY